MHMYVYSGVVWSDNSLCFTFLVFTFKLNIIVKQRAYVVQYIAFFFSINTINLQYIDRINFISPWKCCQGPAYISVRHWRLLELIPVKIFYSSTSKIILRTPLHQFYQAERKEAKKLWSTSKRAQWTSICMLFIL